MFSQPLRVFGFPLPTSEPTSRSQSATHVMLLHLPNSVILVLLEPSVFLAWRTSTSSCFLFLESCRVRLSLPPRGAWIPRRHHALYNFDFETTGAGARGSDRFGLLVLARPSRPSVCPRIAINFSSSTEFSSWEGPRSDQRLLALPMMPAGADRAILVPPPLIPPPLLLPSLLC